MDASLGGSQSFIWRSIFEAKQASLQVLVCIFAWGEKINIIAQPWLNDTVNPFVTTETLSS